MNDLYLLRPQSVVKEGDARDVTARPVEASDKSSLNGSVPFAKTIGIFAVAALAAREGSEPPPVKITDT
jgi:hypothetical protein